MANLAQVEEFCQRRGERTTTADDERVIAVHEAAHAVVASALGFRVKTVSLDSGVGGEMQIEPTPSMEDSPGWVARHVFLSLAV